MSLTASSPTRSVATRRSGGRARGEIWLAAAEHERPKVEMILVDETEIGEAPRQIGSGDVDGPLTSAFRRLRMFRRCCRRA